jgi:hypothetical protein
MASNHANHEVLATPLHERLLRCGQFVVANVGHGSSRASRFAKLAARILSSELMMPVS